MQEIPLTQGLVTQVDDEDYDFLNQWKWHYSKGYAMRIQLFHGLRISISMSKLIMKTPKNMECDHVFHNTLDNRKFIEVDGEIKQNLRNCTHSDNCANRRITTVNKYKGVKTKKGKYDIKYQARIKINGSEIHLGTFSTDIDAAKAYDTAAKDFFGKYAILNFK